ncbi:Histone deacetylation protein Rxt3 [Macleaya cordata]|uniref:Histone deacetylation protein Rxt3 n=1 Tax=Macleaya cordata TaxID=56857 RepID=A0A200QLA8_MACCD|nr:Histone deacetylation protein Rxt3 [Macleaya cordata]
MESVEGMVQRGNRSAGREEWRRWKGSEKKTVSRQWSGRWQSMGVLTVELQFRAAEQRDSWQPADVFVSKDKRNRHSFQFSVRLIMSGAPKRQFDEGSHPMTSKQTIEDINAFPSKISGKLVQSGSNEYHPLPPEQGSDGRLAKMPRIESRDADKRSPLLPMYRMPLSSGDACLDYPVSSENRQELRDAKDNKDRKVENRVAKAETKELHVEPRIDPLCSRVEKDIRIESRGDDNNEIKHDREPCMEFKSGTKMEKSIYASGNTLPNQKEPKEHPRGNRYSDTSDGSLAAWLLPQNNLQGANEIGKEHSTTEARIDSQCATRVEKDVRIDKESRGSDDKETKHNREPHVEFKSEVKMEKDSYAGNAQLNWKEPKEHHRGSRYSDTSAGSLAAWLLPQNSLQGPNEIGKEPSATEDPNYLGAHESFGENKVGTKGDDRLKEKDRKRKDEKHKDWGEREKDRNDRRNNMQQGYSSSERRESTKGERKLERWEKERKDLHKEEKPKERENDIIKKETLNGTEKEVFNAEKELVDGSAKMPEQENPATEQKRLKDCENQKALDRDAKERRQERDADVEGDGQGKRRCYDKESDDGCTEGDGGSEREREVFGYGVQQRRRMLRPRGSPQVANREPRFRSRSRDNEGSQGKPEVSSVVYKVGDCMQELIKLWKEFEASQDNSNDGCSHSGPTLEIRIPAEYVTATNRQVRGGQLWGTDIYTDDSDLVAVLMHTGYCRPTASPPPTAIQELCATIRVLPPQYCYMSTLRNNVRSRAWGAATGCSYRVERCCIVKKGGGSIDLEPCLTHTSTVEPTLAPVAVERTITTRSAASNALRQQRFVREVTIQYNHCNEPWIKYSISIVADKGLKKPLYTSARLKKGEVLYLETHTNRYELCFNGEKTVSATSQIPETDKEKLQTHNNSHASNGERNLVDRETMVIDGFRWSRCKKLLPQKVMRSIGIPLPLEYLEVLEDSLDWEDVQWSQTGVWIAGKEYALARVHFLSL